MLGGYERVSVPFSLVGAPRFSGCWRLQRLFLDRRRSATIYQQATTSSYRNIAILISSIRNSAMPMLMNYIASSSEPAGLVSSMCKTILLVPGQAGYPVEPAVHASMFTDGTAQNSADFVYFSGHGDAGVTSLYQYDPSTNGDCYNNGEADVTCFWYETAGTPTSGRLKWIMSFASQDTGDNHWPYIFNTFTNGLHGYYGIEGEPGSLNDTGNAFADAFANDALSAGSNGPESVHSAWINAAGAINAPVGEWELQSALSDKLSSQSSASGQYGSGNPVVHTNESGQTLFPLSLSPLNTKSPGLYQPRTLTTESYSDSALGQKVDQNEGGSLKYYPTSNQYRVMGQSGTGSHYEASGAILASSENSSLAETFSQQDALTFAQQSAQQNTPLPSDAQLQYAVSLYRTPVNQAPILMGYEFTWVHSDLMLGGDFIKMGVDNVSKRVCTDWTQNDPPYHNHCIAWETQYSQHLNYYYRLWRQRGSLAARPRRVASNAVNSPALSPAQAYSVVSANPRIRGAHLGTLNGYRYAYWTPPFSSTDNTAYPAYHFFYSSHYVVSADAHNGQFLGVNANIQ